MSKGVSIHASAKDATIRFMRPLAVLIVSIHASAKDATFSIRARAMPSLFQSTHPQRMRLLVGMTGSIYSMFQSTHPQRMRPTNRFEAFNSLIVSIHASAKDATQAPYTSYLNEKVSIHASAKDATRSCAYN